MTRALLAALLGAVIGPVAAAAQATLRGRVLDSEMGQPLIGAAVRMGADTAPVATSDSLGFFRLQKLPRGNVDLSIQLLGYEEGRFKVFMPDSGTIYRQFALDFNGFMLPEVVVQARAEVLQPRYVDFERRRVRKLGAFFRWDDLKKQSYSSVGDALRTVRGVRIQCDQSRFECYAVMARTPNCHPTWYIDGIEVHSFHENTPIRDIYGIEVYRGSGEIPGEYSGSNAGCGVIVMWTKSRPYR
ncbi:MAG TPA: carboxypeptidase-like regulatory domain-containing protein [Gemmatimonadales bacterium]|nr:carboxypeptidase-like regulatory domain-containing protein [Gemmatimonadales bacterium]